MFDVTFQRTHTERAGDSSRPFMYNRTLEHEDRIVAHRKRVQREYFDSGLCEKEMHEHYSKLPNNPRTIRSYQHDIALLQGIIND